MLRLRASLQLSLALYSEKGWKYNFEWWAPPPSSKAAKENKGFMIESFFIALMARLTATIGRLAAVIGGLAAVIGGLAAVIGGLVAAIGDANK